MSEPTGSLPSQAVDPDLEPGETVGEYRVENKLGQGGFGAVFKAVHPLIGKQVAIKVLARRFSVDPDMVDRFVAEAKSVNQIRNRHIIDIFSFGKLPDGRAYYVMEYLDGEPLDALIDRQGALPLAVALPILRAIARALDAAHGKGIAHRDLKPENVFLAKDPDGDAFPKLLDFGIAKLMNPDDGLKTKTRTGMPIGTPFYMSPEQCRGKDVDHRTDYYAYGVLAYQMLTGTRPFDADDVMGIMMKQIGEEAEPASKRNPALPAGVDEVLAWLMAKDPAQRPPNLVSALRTLEHAAQEAGIPLPAGPMSQAWDVQTAPRVAPTLGPPAKPAVTTPPVAKRPMPIVAVTIAAALAVIGVGAAAYVELTKHGEEGPRASGLGPPQTPAPAPAPAPPPAPTPPPAPAPATVIVTVSGVPAGTQVTIDGKLAGTAPGQLVLPSGSASVSLELTAKGYVKATKVITPDKDQALDLQLQKAPTKTGPAKRDSHDIEDPFR